MGVVAPLQQRAPARVNRPRHRELNLREQLLDFVPDGPLSNLSLEEALDHVMLVGDLLGCACDRVSLVGQPAPALFEGLTRRGLTPWVDPSPAPARAVLHWRDALGRSWPLSWIEIDSAGRAQPYEQVDGDHVTYRAFMLSSLEGGLALLLEQRGGLLPLWLATEQVRVLAVSRAHLEYAEELTGALRTAGVRVGFSSSRRSGPLAGRVRDAVEARVPCLAVVGQQECEDRSVTVRCLPGDQRNTQTLSRFVEWARAESNPPIPNRRYGHSPP